MRKIPRNACDPKRVIYRFACSDRQVQYMSREEATASVVVCRTEGGPMGERQLDHEPSGKHKESAVGRVRFCASGWRSVSSIGIACTLAWAFLVNAAGGGVPGQQTSWQLSYAVLSVVVVVLGFSASKHPAVLGSKRKSRACGATPCDCVTAAACFVPGADVAALSGAAVLLHSPPPPVSIKAMPATHATTRRSPTMRRSVWRK